MRIKSSIVGFVLIAVCCFCHAGFGQNSIGTEGPVPKTVATCPTNCEENSALLDAASSAAESNSFIIAVARLGDLETQQGLNQRRLHNVKMYLKEFAGRDIQSMVTAEGERVPGYGRIELYVNGKHFKTILIKPNLDLAVGECSFEGVDPCTIPRERKLYPCLRKKGN